MKSEEKVVTPLFGGGGWAFETDPIHPWAYWENGFTSEECDEIIKIGNEKILRTATIISGELSKVRTSETSWIYPTDDAKWIFNKISYIITSLNNEYFKFDLFGLIEGFQFTKYIEPGGKYAKHVDSAFGIAPRKLSLTLQLSDPKDYVGGDLKLHYQAKALTMRKDRGFISVFPSYTLHEVTPVTKGTRYSLVCWVSGPPFR